MECIRSFYQEIRSLVGQMGNALGADNSGSPGRDNTYPDDDVSSEPARPVPQQTVCPQHRMAEYRGRAMLDRSPPRSNDSQISVAKLMMTPPRLLDSAGSGGLPFTPNLPGDHNAGGIAGAPVAASLPLAEAALGAGKLMRERGLLDTFGSIRHALDNEATLACFMQAVRSLNPGEGKAGAGGTRHVFGGMHDDPALCQRIVDAILHGGNPGPRLMRVYAGKELLDCRLILSRHDEVLGQRWYACADDHDEILMTLKLVIDDTLCASSQAVGYLANLHCDTVVLDAVDWACADRPDRQ